ncbi:phage/plasmid primase, P4 family [Citrobacter sp. Cf097]|uniref:phage/plasmid primase, P4 family n=1 Tax=Citrobacter TaxID=544 RepID=UPI00254CB1B8|nr:MULTISPECIES: phage/plasmid primase, P4 family [Citrobacter]MDM3202882.1 phage/plasmid primase, P4 family [Citrobacter sp. Cf097]
MQHNYADINAQYDGPTTFSIITGIGIKPLGANHVEPEDKTCPHCGHKDCFRFFLDSNKSHCFACGGEYPDSVIDLVMKLNELSSPAEAANALLAMDFEPYTPATVTPTELVRDTRDLERVVETNAAITEYYHRNLLGNMSAFAYQSVTRGHNPKTVVEAKVGYADGKLVAALREQSFSDEDILETGMARLQNGRLVDFAPAGVYAYPHFVDGKVTRFTFKDPAKDFKFQQPKRYWLPGAFWYGQESLERPGAIALVEGENDRLALMEVYDGPVLASIGSVSREQVEFIESLGREVITFFDHDDAGDRYRQKFDAQHIIVPVRGSDIDSYLRGGGDFMSLLATFTPKFEVIAPLAAGACGSESFNDTGNANRMARLYGPGLRYIGETDTFIHWLDHCWVPAGVQILEYAKQTANAVLAEGQAMLASDDENIRKRGADQVAYANRLHNLSLMKAMIELLKPKVEVRTVELDADPMLVRVKNGVIELKTQCYRENRRQDLITSVCPVEYDPKAACPAWERFIVEITCGDAELAAFLKRLVGYMLTGRTDEQLLFFFYGHGSNGKSTFIQIIQALMGTYATQINSDVLMANRSVGGPNASLAKLPGKRLVVANELPEGGRFDDMLIKSMTGGDTLVARQVYGKHEIEFTAQFSLVIIGNHKPIIHDMSHGMWRRMCLIPFAAQFSAEQADPTLPARLLAELPGILNWALEGVAEWHEHGLKRSLPAAVVKANNDYREESDLLGEFLSGCILQPDAYTPATELYQAFQTFACEGNEWRMTQRVFNKKMAERGFTKLRRDSKAGFRGIALTADMPRVFESVKLTV